MTAILIDDELDALDVLSILLKQYCPQVEIVASTSDAKEGIDLVRKHKPNILFLDIQMPMMGFEVLDKLKKQGNDSFNLIFTTAYDKFAMKGLNEYDPVYYLLKPIDSDELIKAVEKVQQQEPAILPPPILIGIHTFKGIVMIERENIIMFSVKEKITKCYLINRDEPYTCLKSLSNIEKILNNRYFFRIHRNYLINIKQIKSYEKKENLIVMNNGQTANIALDKKKEFENLFEHL